MLDPLSVTTQATKGIVDELAAEYEVTLTRMYEILGKDNPYVKTRRLIKAIARHNQDGARLIKSDLDALFTDILFSDFEGDLNAALLHKEAFEAIQSILENKCKADRMRELRELITIAELMLEGVNKKCA